VQRGGAVFGAEEARARVKTDRRDAVNLARLARAGTDGSVRAGDIVSSVKRSCLEKVSYP